MEDTSVIKTHYAYMFRVDLSNNIQSEKQIHDWIEKFNFTYYHGQHEIGTTTGKHHYQMVVWREHKFQDKQQTKARNWWRGKVNSKRNGVALTSARKVATLVSYSQKGYDVSNPDLKLFSNLSDSQLSRIPNWINKTAKKTENKVLLAKRASEISALLDKNEFICEFSKIYYEIYDRPCLHKNTYITWLYKKGYMDDRCLVNYVFQYGVPGCQSLIYEDDDVYEKNEILNYKI